MLKKCLTYLVIIAMACVNAVNYELFVFPNQFAPSGLNGLCTMFQYVTQLNMGYLNLLLNLPLAIAVYFKVSKSLALRSMTYVLCFSGMLLVLDYVDLSAFAYSTPSSTILGPLVAGIIYGTICSILLKAGAYAGGTDFVSSLIHKYHPHFNFFYTVFAMNVGVACISYFVYDFKIEPVLMCILYSFTTSMLIDKSNKSGRSAVRFEIITEHPEELSRLIIEKLHHSATILPGKGIYKGKETNLLICVVNKPQAATMSAIIKSLPGTFAVCSTVSEVMGNFKRLDNKNQRERELLDQGDGNGL